jgi:hypothetical protein
MSRAHQKALRIAYGAVIPLPPDEAFSFVSDPENWLSFISSLRESSKDDAWGRVGGRGQMSNVVLGRRIASEIELTVWDPPHEFRYVSRQPGAPLLDNRRLLEPVPGGTRLSGTTTVTPRAGPAALVDRVRVLALQRIFATAMARLPEAARASRAQPPD